MEIDDRKASGTLGLRSRGVKQLICVGCSEA